MQVNVKLFASLREGRFKTEVVDFDSNSRVIDVMNKYELPPEEVAICLVNGRDADNEHVLQNGDTVSLFPPVGGG
ncbi:MAG: molybdenum cofactor biosynthesis protein MoaD [Clostridia bacterium]|jgi:sulfur carrier protein|nr:molybdenum cofactor biosynthesis protein MoaD [Clostridia bacterium]